MKSLLLSSIAVAAFALAPSAAQAQCAPDITTGQCIAGTLYGNISNPRPDGPGVLPSLAPGPWACVYELGECQGDETDAGVSVGDIVGQGKSNFANGKDPGPGFGEK
jgi:hypothetical protein